MENLTIQFPSMQQLWAFQRSIQLHNFHFNSNTCTLKARFTTDQIQEAVTSFQGQVVARQKIA